MSSRPVQSNPAVVRLAEKRLRTLELASAQHPVSPARKHLEVHPFVCFSRMVGSGGTQVATLLGERLGWTVYDKEILQAMAGDDELRARLYASLDERDLSWTEATLRGLMEAGFSRNDYFHRLTQTILYLVRAQAAVFIGRGADLVLPRERGLRVRIVAPREQCIRNFSERYGLSLSKARTEIERVETERAAFVRTNFHREPDDQTRYDLILNLGAFTVPDAAEMIQAALRIHHLLPSGH